MRFSRLAIRISVCGPAILTAIPALVGQPGPPARQQQTRVVSPEVAPDHQVTFRLYAPDAHQVTVGGSFLAPGSPRVAMTKADDGNWSVTVGPIAPSVSEYTFTVDGVSMMDPRNTRVKHAARGAGVSVLLVPSDPPAVWQMRDVPHGTVHVHWYPSQVAGETRRFHVYTPPGYDPAAKKKYPVLYLLHGSGDTDEEWLSTGQANMIFDNLIADGKAKPMVVVMPFGHIRAKDAPAAGPAPGDTSAFEKDLVGDIMPLVERSYRVDARRESRAIAGLSMGGRQSLYIGLGNLDRFAYLGVFSMGIRDDSFEKQFAAVLGDPAGTNRKLKLFWIGCGDKDFLWTAAQKLDATLTNDGIRHVFHKSEGGHVWNNWVNYLAELAPQLFQREVRGAPASAN